MSRVLKRDQMLDHVEILLFDILEELKKLNENREPEAAKPCPHCGQVHENAGKFLACAKKHKKKEGD